MTDGSQHNVCNITYVDDNAVMLVARSPSILFRLAPLFAEAMVQAAEAFGFLLNWEENKTECFISLRGKMGCIVVTEARRHGLQVRNQDGRGHEAAPRSHLLQAPWVDAGGYGFA